MAKHKFNAATWVDDVDAIPGIDAYVGQRGDEEWLGVTFGHHGEDRVTEAGMDAYSTLAAEMNTTDGAVDAIIAELERRGRVIRFRGSPAS